MLKQRTLVSDALLAVERLMDLLRRGREIEVDLLVELERFEREKMHEVLGYRSFWALLTRRLGLLECAAFYRMHASRLIGRFPSALPRLRDGRLCATNLVELRDVIDESNAEDLFEQVAGKPRRTVVDLVTLLKAKATPIPDGESNDRAVRPPYTIRKAPAPKAAVVTREDLTLREQLIPTPMPAPAPAPPPRPAASATTNPEPTPAPEPIPSPSEQAAFPSPIVLLVASRGRKTEIRALDEDLYDISMRVQKRFVERIEEARIAEGHAVPDGDLETLLLRGLDLLIERAGKKTGNIYVKSDKRTESIVQNPDSPHIGASLRREVMVRDDHRCRWEMAEGGVCDSRERVEPDHIRSLAKGGKTVASNLRVLCHEHNAQAAREQLGEEFVAERIRDAQAKRAAKREAKSGQTAETNRIGERVDDSEVRSAREVPPGSRGCD